MRYNSRLFVRVTLLVLGLLLCSVVTTVQVLAQEPTRTSVTLPEYVLSCYDSVNKGFGSRPGENATLESTLEAVRLLVGETDTAAWSVELRQAVDEIVEHYVSLQVDGRGGFAFSEGEAPDVQATALILETLRVLNRLDAIDIDGVVRYLRISSYGHGRTGFTLDRWLTEGDFEYKYWMLRAAAAIDGVPDSSGVPIAGPETIGLTRISLHRHVLAPEANRADFPENEPYLVWGQTLFSQGRGLDADYASPE